MKYSDFVKLVAKEAEVSQTDAKRVLDSANLLIKDVVKKGDEVVLHGVGKFSKKTRPERQGLNPATGKRITIPAKEVVTFKAAKEFTDHIND